MEVSHSTAVRGRLTRASDLIGLIVNLAILGDADGLDDARLLARETIRSLAERPRVLGLTAVLVSMLGAGLAVTISRAGLGSAVILSGRYSREEGSSVRGVSKQRSKGACELTRPGP